MLVTEENLYVSVFIYNFMQLTYTVEETVDL